MKRIFLTIDKRENNHYNEFIGWTFRKKGIIIKSIKLLDNSIGKRRKQKVKLLITSNINYISVEVIKGVE